MLAPHLAHADGGGTVRAQRPYGTLGNPPDRLPGQQPGGGVHIEHDVMTSQLQGGEHPLAHVIELP